MDYKKLSRVVDSLNNKLYNEFIKLIEPFKLVDEPLVAKSSKGSFADLQVYMPDNGRFTKDTKSLKLVLKDGWKEALVKAGWHLMDEDSYNAMMKGLNLSLPFIKSSDLKNIFKKGVHDRAFLDAKFPKEIKANTTYVPDSSKVTDGHYGATEEEEVLMDNLITKVGEIIKGLNVPYEDFYEDDTYGGYSCTTYDVSKEDLEKVRSAIPQIEDLSSGIIAVRVYTKWDSKDLGKYTISVTPDEDGIYDRYKTFNDDQLNFLKDVFSKLQKIQGFENARFWSSNDSWGLSAYDSIDKELYRQVRKELRELLNSVRARAEELDIKFDASRYGKSVDFKASLK